MRGKDRRGEDRCQGRKDRRGKKGKERMERRRVRMDRRKWRGRIDEIEKGKNSKHVNHDGANSKEVRRKRG